MIAAILMIVVAAGYRVLAVHEPAMSNFAPLMALTFCGGMYFRDRRLWLVPFIALVLSDVYIDRYYAMQYGYLWTVSGSLVRSLCFLIALGLGAVVALKKSWLNVLSGVVGGAVFFYVVTNTQSWFTDLSYAKSLAGWWEAMTVGHPEFPPTLLFFRNSLASDLIFTGAFVLLMEYRALRADQPSLLKRQDA
jgi:hypothetical protein